MPRQELRPNSTVQSHREHLGTNVVCEFMPFVSLWEPFWTTNMEFTLRLYMKVEEILSSIS